MDDQVITNSTEKSSIKEKENLTKKKKPFEKKKVNSKKFKPAWWLYNRHLQSIWSFYFRKRMPIKTRTERFELIDGDFLEALWVGPSTGPIVVVLHGLEGSINSIYANAMLHSIQQQGWRGLCIHFRNCGGTNNRLDRHYHIGDTGDIMNVLSIIRNREPNVQLTAVGYSLGGNVLLKWLGEMGKRCPLKAAVAVSVPFKLAIASELASSGLSRMYEKYFLDIMKKSLTSKFKNRPYPPVDLQKMEECNTFIEFDEYITAPLHGFNGSAEYYQKSSSCFYLKGISKPTLIVQALDDPLVPPEAVPDPDDFSPETIVELYPCGGHVGFVSGNIPGKAEYWLEERVIDFFKSHLE